MADKDPSDGPSLELPKLFGRKKDKTRRGRAEEATPPAGQAREAESTPAEEPRSAGSTPAEEPAAPPEPAAAAEPTAPVPVVDPAEATMPLPVAAPERTATERAAPDEVAPDQGPAPEPAATATEPPPTPEPRRRREPALPSIPSGPAAVLVGAVIGGLGILLTWLGLLGCEAIRGTESCGGPGLVVMLAIMVAMVVVGAALLKLLGVPQGGSLSFLGFGILAVVVLMFLLDHLDNLWVLVSIPVISALGYGVAHWVTTRFTEPDPDFTH